jgi:hypothetical protein
MFACRRACRLLPRRGQVATAGGGVAAADWNAATEPWVGPVQLSEQWRIPIPIATQHLQVCAASGDRTTLQYDPPPPLLPHAGCRATRRAVPGRQLARRPFLPESLPGRVPVAGRRTQAHVALTRPRHVSSPRGCRRSSWAPRRSSRSLIVALDPLPVARGTSFSAWMRRDWMWRRLHQKRSLACRRPRRLQPRWRAFRVHMGAFGTVRLRAVTHHHVSGGGDGGDEMEGRGRRGGGSEGDAVLS